MPKYGFLSLALASIIGLNGCGGDDQTISESAPLNKTFVVFSPVTSEFPIPNDLLFSSEPAADGTMNAGTDPANPVISGIDALDGNSVLAPFDIAFTGSLDTAQNLDASSFVLVGTSVVPNPNQNVFLLPLAYPSGDGLSQATVDNLSVEIPTFAEVLAYQTANATSDDATLGSLASPTARAEIISLDDGSNNVLRISPLKPLLPKTKYLVVVTGLQDANGNPVYASEAYSFIRDPETNLANFGAETAARLTPLQGALLGWERLATGYFGFMQTEFDQKGMTESASSAEDIIFSITFTTGGTTDVLTYMTAPELFFEDSLSASYKKSAISSLVGGDYTVAGVPDMDAPTEFDFTVNATLAFLLTSPTLDGSPAGEGPANALYNASIAGAIAAGADYATIAADATAAYIMQRAATEAAISAANGDGISIALESIGTVQAIVAGASAQLGVDLPTSAVFPVPAARATSFYKMDAASEINPALEAPARVYQGEITLPYFLQKPVDSDLSPVVSSSWVANATIGGAIDIGQGNLAGTTPPSDMITYRYPFPTKQSDVTVPLLVTIPDEATLGAFGISKPEDGWPVIIFVHGITGERSQSLPMADALAFACVARDEAENPTGPNPGVPCFATIAIDQPLHGIPPAGSSVPGLFSVTDPDASITSNIGDSDPSPNLTERHFNATSDATASPIPMDYSSDSGSSGSLFINLSNFAGGRDNLRQMVIDLLNLNASIATMDLDADGIADDLDSGSVYFIGHSLGAIDGLPFVAVNNEDAVQNSVFSSQPMIKAAAGLFTGGGLTRLLTNSPAFAPSVLQGLTAASDELTQGRSGLESYLSIFQGVLDSADVTNFGHLLSDANSTTGILLTEVVGDAQNAADQTIPNAADVIFGTAPLNTNTSTGFTINGFPAPLSGTEPMITQFGAIPTDVVAAESDGDAEVIVTRFTQGTHSTPVSADNADVFAEIVTEIVGFFTRNGIVTESIISNQDIVE
ncbi:MAG: hypothetical protein ACI9Y1_002194 [Lentisphaeria bacterium]|jgi:hypothetical protein